MVASKSDAMPFIYSSELYFKDFVLHFTSQYWNSLIFKKLGLVYEIKLKFTWGANDLKRVASREVNFDPHGSALTLKLRDKLGLIIKSFHISEFH